MVQRTVLKVDISCQKCKKKVMKAISKLDGVDKIELDVGKGTVTVTGDADPLKIILCARNAGKWAEVVTIGPPAPPPKPDGSQKKPEDKKNMEQQAPIHNPVICHECQRMGLYVVPYYDSPSVCSIL